MLKCTHMHTHTHTHTQMVTQTGKTFGSLVTAFKFFPSFLALGYLNPKP
jgi:hypothetical protein